MRGDMPKVIVERPRRGSRVRLSNRARVGDDEMLPSKLSVRRDAMMRGGSRELNENLNPLKRYLASQVGRPWNKVWSEISKNLKPSSTVQQHVRDHIPDFVATKTSLKEGEVWVHDRWSSGPLKMSYAKLFVDPKSGLLRRNKHWRSWATKKREQLAVEKKAREARMRVVSVRKQFHLLNDGAWWEVTLAAIPRGIEERQTPQGRQRYEVEKRVADTVIGAGLAKLDRAELYGRPGVYAVAKRQLSKKEMRDLGLR